MSNTTKEPYYQTIDEMPIGNWNDIFKSGDLKHIFKSGEGRVSKKIGEVWVNIQNQYIEEFGLDDNFKKQLKLLKEKSKLNYEFILTKDRFINTLMAIVDADLESLKQSKGMNFYEVKDHAEKYKGYRLDPKEITVIEWFTTLKNMSDNGKNN